MALTTKKVVLTLALPSLPQTAIAERSDIALGRRRAAEGDRAGNVGRRSELREPRDSDCSQKSKR